MKGVEDGVETFTELSKFCGKLVINSLEIPALVFRSSKYISFNLGKSPQIKAWSDDVVFIISFT